MGRKLPALAIIVASVATPNTVHSANFLTQQERIQDSSLFEVINLLNRRSGHLYFAAQGELVRVRYAPFSETVFIDVVKNATIGEQLRELSPEDPLMAKLSGDFTPDLAIRSEGRVYGDNKNDHYLPLNQPVMQGYQIGPAERAAAGKYFQHIGNLLR